MLNHTVSAVTLTVTLAATIALARADQPTAPAQSQPSAPAGVPAGVDDATPPPIPPYVEGQPIMAAGGNGYCYVGPHPTDTRVTGGPTFDPTDGAHLHEYAPIDLRLFTYREGCYYFIGDPRDFGYGGQSYSYYGAHPVLDNYGGGWCFMMGGHHHLWRPWSPYFTVVGPWNYWYGPYDPFFWSYWPYYSFYYRSYYPHYYAGGRYYRGGYRAAPSIRRVPPTGGWRGTPSGMAGAGGGWRGAPPAGTTAPLRSGAGGPGTWGGGGPGGGWRGSPATGGVRSYSSPLGGSPSIGGGGWRGGGGGGGAAPSGGGWRARPR